MSDPLTHSPREPREAHRNYRPRAWCRDAGISRTTLYDLAPAQQPRSVMIGRMRLITESPREWASRIGRAS